MCVCPLQLVRWPSSWTLLSPPAPPTAAQWAPAAWGAGGLGRQPGGDSWFISRTTLLAEGGRVGAKEGTGNGIAYGLFNASVGRFAGSGTGAPGGTCFGDGVSAQIVCGRPGGGAGGSGYWYSSNRPPNWGE